jgi:predicted Fe-Mo cluster-binding NifX family protein
LVIKVAVVSENGTTLSQHFGRAPFYMVHTVENGKITGKEKRSRSADNICACHHDESGGCHSNHGMDAESQNKHTSMADSLSDCQVLIAGGMGYGAYQALRSRNIDTLVTDVESIDEAVKLYLKGKLVNLMEE